MCEINYDEIYSNAAVEIINEYDEYSYNGYTGASALSLYVYDKHGINAANNNAAHDALCGVIN